MEWYHRVSMIVLLCLSVFLCGLGIYKFTRKSPVSKQKRSAVSRMLWLSLCLIASVWSLRYAVGLYKGVVETDPTKMLTWWEELFNSFMHALQTFSMDEEYTAYILYGKRMFREVIGGHVVWQHLFILYASALNIVAPIAGGAIVLEVLASIFPQLRLRWSYISGWRKKYFFSELNVASLALAKDICRERQEKKQSKPILIFTDTYVDNENEKDYELLLEAKEYGAICVREDLEHVIKPRYGEREYYLMDENEAGNLQTLLSLTKDHNIPYIRKAPIYFFVQTDAYIQVEKQIRQKLQGRKEFATEKDLPTITPVMSYRNLVHNLFVNVPLYEPLVHKQDPTQLNLTIFGNGTIGTETLLSAYWFGQLMISRTVDGKETMQPCKLNIHVVSKDTPDAFWSKLDYVNPEIGMSIRRVWEEEDDQGNSVIVVQEPNENLLRYSKKGVADPYCQVRYVQSDLQFGSFWKSRDVVVQELLGADYFVVALGTDAVNISMAEKLRNYLGKKHIEAAQDAPAHQAVIAYAVFDSKLAETLNRQKQFRSKSEGMADLYMYAFGDLDQVYSCNNVYMSDNKVWAEETGAAYARAQQSRTNDGLLTYSDSHLEKNFNRIWAADYENANYNHWANLARAMHVKYKVFSLGWIRSSLFHYQVDTDCETVHREHVKVQCELYRKMAVISRPKELAGEDKTRYEEIERKKHVLAWLEHRRWCAFTRTMGYQHVHVDVLLAQGGRHKDMRLKLHACLVEARMPQLDSEKGNVYIDAKFDETGRVDSSSILTSPYNLERDRLDEVTYAKRDGDFKEYDYYTYELDRKKFYCDSDLQKLLKDAKIGKFAMYCDPSQYHDVVCCSISGKDGVCYRNYFCSDEVVKRIKKTHVKIAEDKNIKSKRKLEIAGASYLPKFGARFIQWLCAVDSKSKTGDYVPHPKNTTAVLLPKELETLAEQIAENVHENWAQARVSEGWRYGVKRNDRKKTTFCLVPYAKLPESEKNYDRRTAFETLRFVMSLGYDIHKRKDNQDNNVSDAQE